MARRVLGERVLGGRVLGERLLMLGIALMAVAALSGCVAAVVHVDPPPAVPASTDSRCNHQAIRSCLLPYPSDQYLVADPTTRTGYRVDVPADVVPPAVLSQFGPGAGIDDAFGGADGFSAVTPIIFETAEKVQPASLPPDGGNVLIVTNADTGERIPIRAELSADAERYVGHERTIVIAWPVTKFPYGAHIAAVLNDGLVNDAGVTVSKAPGLVSAKALFMPMLSRAAAAGSTAGSAAAGSQTTAVAATAWSHVLSATSFVVRSQRNVTDTIDQRAAVVRAQDHPIRHVVVGPSIIGGNASVTGQVRVTDFRDADHVMPTSGAASSELWIDFLMILPDHPATPAGTPVVIYGHGISVSKETMLVVAGQNARHGLATVGIDIPNHGSRSYEGWLLSLATPSLFGRLAAMPAQGELDQLSLFMAIKQHFAEIDVQPYHWWSGSSPDGRPDLDPTHVLYEGTSMGGFLGAAFAALTPELNGAFLQVAGSGITDTIFHSVLWWLFTPIEPTGVSAGDGHALMGSAGMLLDRAENTYLMDRIKNSKMPFYLSYAANDGTVPNADSERMVRETDIPLVGDLSKPVPGLRTVPTMPADGRGAIQTSTSAYTFFTQLTSHTSFTDPYPTAALDAWLDQRIASWG